MKVTPSFKGALNNKYLLSGLKNISEHGTSFAAVTTLFMSTGLRTFSILKTPSVEKENKQYAASNSICSGLVKFAMVEAAALPVENIIKKIDKNPEKYLKKSALNLYKSGVHKISNSKSYSFITQIIKLSTGFLTAVPKSVITISLIPLIMDNVFQKKPVPKKPRKTKHPSFKNRPHEFFAGCFGKFLSQPFVIKFAKKYSKLDTDINKHITAATDILLAATSAVQINKSRKIKENRKKPLIYNNIIPTAFTLIFGYGIDRVIKSGSRQFIEKFKRANALDINLPKYIEGINIVRPTLIFAAIYYGLLPVFSTFMAEKTDKFLTKH